MLSLLFGFLVASWIILLLLWFDYRWRADVRTWIRAGMMEFDGRIYRITPQMKVEPSTSWQRREDDERIVPWDGE